MKKLFSLILSIIFSFSVFFAYAVDLTDCTPKTFTISGYYSPLPGQSFYLNGDYYDEISMNGNGTHGASGKPVFEGMIAAPKSYTFGTKIYLPGFGMGEVADRGGAIVKSGEKGQSYDRLDLWMGHGELGLKKAMTVGKRKVDGYICSKENKANFETDNVKISNIKIGNTKKAETKKVLQTKTKTVSTKVEKVEIINIQAYDLAEIKSNSFKKGQKSEMIAVLQDGLRKLGYYKSDINGIYDNNTIEAVYHFQQDNGLVNSLKDSTAGFFGPKTQDLLNQKLDNLHDKIRDNNKMKFKFLRDIKSQK